MPTILSAVRHRQKADARKVLQSMCQKAAESRSVRDWRVARREVTIDSIGIRAN
jgi:hypothetical protein